MTGRAALLAFALAISAPAGLHPVMAEERPAPIAPYRYLVPSDAPRGSPAEQGAYSYRNELSAERLRLERSLSGSEDAASRLRRQGDLNREIDRMDRLLSR